MSLRCEYCPLPVIDRIYQQQQREAGVSGAEGYQPLVFVADCVRRLVKGPCRLETDPSADLDPACATRAPEHLAYLIELGRMSAFGLKPELLTSAQRADLLAIGLLPDTEMPQAASAAAEGNE